MKFREITEKKGMKFKIFIFLIVCSIAFSIIGGLIPPLKTVFEVLRRACGVAEVVLVLAAVFKKLFGKELNGV